MAVADALTSGRGALVQRPKTALLGALGALVVLDLLAKLAGFRLILGGTQLLGGQLGVERLIGLGWNGIVVGLAIGLAGIGLSMTYSILGFANFAHGDYVTAGGFAGWSAAWVVAGLQTGQFAGNGGYLATVGYGSGPSPSDLGINIVNSPLAVILGLLVAAVGSVLLVLLMDRIVFKPMRDQSGISLLIGSIGVALALRYIVASVYNTETRGLTQTGQRVSLGLLEVTSAELTLVVASLALMLGLHLLLQRTKLGKAMRAMADNEDLARVTGIPAERVVRYAWIIGGGMAGSAGFLIALERGAMNFQFGWLLLLLIFAAVILGGIGSIYGAMVGGVVIGLTSSMALIWIPNSFSTAAAFLIMILMLLVRPEGLFGGVTTA